MSKTNIKFQNSNGEQLSAILELPIDQRAHNFVVFAHCFTCNKNFRAVRSISSALSAEGFGVLSFDFTGLGASDGAFEDTNFSSSVDDLVSAAGFLEQEFEAPTLIVGHSLGGSAALLAANKIDSISAVVTIGSPAEPNHVKNLLESNIGEINEKGIASVSIGGRPFTVKQQFVDDLDAQNIKNVVGKMNKSFLFLHSPQDSIVDVENAAILYGAARHPKSFVSLDGADHLLSNSNDSNYAGRVIATWADRYVMKPETKEIEVGNQLVAYLSASEKFTTRILSNRHRMTADEPVEFGGNDFGPSPYQFIAGGLAACTVMTLRMYADRKHWDLGEVYCRVDHDKKHVTDCAECEKPESKIDVFERELEFSSELTNDQLKRLLEIANKCPVHRTLESIARIKTTLISD